MQETYPEPQKDDIGLYYDHLPKNFKLATLDDFHQHGKIKIGMIYIVQWWDENRYSFRKVNSRLTARKILPFIENEQVYVQDSA